MTRRYLSLFTIAVVAVVAVLGFATAALADHHEGEEAPAEPTLRILHVDEVYPEHAPAFEENARAWVAAFKEAGFGEDMTWWAAQRGGFTYTWLSPLGSFSELDESEARNAMVAEKVGAEKMKELMAGNQYVRSHHTEILRHLPDLSYEGAGDTPPGFVHLGLHSVKPAMDEQFQALVKRVRDAYAEAEHTSSLNVYRTAFGEGSYAISTLAANAGEYYSRPPVPAVLAEMLGEEATSEILAEWRDCINGFETEDYTLRPDLSFIPGMGMGDGEDEEDGDGDAEDGDGGDDEEMGE